MRLQILGVLLFIPATPKTKHTKLILAVFNYFYITTLDVHSHGNGSITIHLEISKSMNSTSVSNVLQLVLHPFSPHTLTPLDFLFPFLWTRKRYFFYLKLEFSAFLPPIVLAVKAHVHWNTIYSSPNCLLIHLRLMFKRKLILMEMYHLT